MTANIQDAAMFPRRILLYIKKVKRIVFQDKIDILSFPLALPVLIAIRLISPFLVIKMGYFLNQNRFGHFVVDTSYEIIRKARYDNKGICIYWIAPNVANKYWMTVVKKHLYFNSIIRPIEKLNRIIPFGSNHTIHPLITLHHASRDMKGLISLSSREVSFGWSEKNIVDEFIVDKTGKLNKFVCLMVRDEQYLLRQLNYDKKNAAEHSYRDSIINSYVRAIEYLMSIGYIVIRMGRDQKNKVCIENNNFIDYAFSEEKSDRLDILLPYYSDFCIGTASGIDSTSEAFGKRTLFLNAMPLEHINSYRDIIWNPKHLLWVHNNERLTLNEVLDHQYMSMKEYDEAGILIKDMSDDEILSATKEFVNHKINYVDYEKSENDKQKLFWGVLLSSRSAQLHEYIHPGCRIGRDWLDTVL